MDIDNLKDLIKDLALTGNIEGILNLFTHKNVLIVNKYKKGKDQRLVIFEALRQSIPAMAGFTNEEIEAYLVEFGQ